jgi:putative transposase
LERQHLARDPKGTPGIRKDLKVVQRANERVANRRYDFAHQVSRDLVGGRLGTVCFEYLNVKGMLHNHSLAKSISDVVWRMLVNMASCKAASAGSMVILVDHRNTSKVCLKLLESDRKRSFEQGSSMPIFWLSTRQRSRCGQEHLRLGYNLCQSMVRRPPNQTG